jgi:hypothetical protein
MMEAARTSETLVNFTRLHGATNQKTAIFIRAMMMEAASASETSVNFYQTTRRNISEDSHLHTHRRENLTSHLKCC